MARGETDKVKERKRKQRRSHSAVACVLRVSLLITLYVAGGPMYVGVHICSCIVCVCRADFFNPHEEEIWDTLSRSGRI